MRGGNHVIMNFSTALGVGGTLAAMHHSDVAFLHNTSDRILKFLFRPDFNVVNTVFSVVMMSAFAAFLYMLGSVLPDIDHPYSGIGKVIHIPVKHRTWTHAIYAVLLFLLLGIKWRLCAWLGLGYFGHLIVDSMSASGVDWIYPKKNNHHFIKLYRTSQFSEKFVVGIWAVVNTLMFVIMMILLIAG